MLTNDQVYTFVTDVLDTYNCGEVPDNVDSLQFFQEACHALESATRHGKDGQRRLDDFAEQYMPGADNAGGTQ